MFSNATVNVSTECAILTVSRSLCLFPTAVFIILFIVEVLLNISKF
jgi:hypothetical protein